MQPRHLSNLLPLIPLSEEALDHPGRVFRPHQCPERLVLGMPQVTAVPGFCGSTGRAFAARFVRGAFPVWMLSQSSPVPTV